MAKLDVSSFEKLKAAIVAIPPQSNPRCEASRQKLMAFIADCEQRGVK